VDPHDIPALQRAAHRGCAESQFYLGARILQGEGQRDHAKAAGPD
jgi:TPR repeat protein